MGTWGCGGELSVRCNFSIDSWQKVPFHHDVKQLVDAILPPIFEIWKTEDDQSVPLHSSIS